MATFYGSYVASAYRVRAEASVTNTSDTQAKVTISVYVEMASGAKDGAWNFQGRGAANGDSWSSWVAGSSSTYLNSGQSAKLTTVTKTVNRTTSDQKIEVWAQVKNTYVSGWAGPSAIAGNTTSNYVTVSKKPTYTVTPNANGGTLAMGCSALTKSHGDSLTLWEASLNPTRANYNFTGWNTAQDGTGTSYPAGGSYTGDGSITLYAQWALAYVAPTITLEAFRSTSGSSDPSSTAQLTFKATWSLDQTGGANTSGQIVFSGYGSSATENISGSVDQQTGTVHNVKTKSVSGTFAGTTAYTITATITDAHGLTATATAVVGVVFKPFSMRNKGNSAAFFGIAGSAWSKILGVYGRLRTIGDNNTGVSIMSTGIENSATDVSTAVDGAPLFLEDKNGAWLTQIRQRFQPSVGQALLIETRRIISSASKYHSIRIGLTTSGKPYVLVSSTESSPNAKQAWFTGIAGWDTLVAGFTGTGSAYKDYTLTGYTELLITVKYSTTYASSILVPVAALSTTATDWYLGAWSYNNSHYNAACKLTTTRITPYKVRVGSTEYQATWTVYAR